VVVQAAVIIILVVAAQVDLEQDLLL